MGAKSWEATEGGSFPGSVGIWGGGGGVWQVEGNFTSEHEYGRNFGKFDTSEIKHFFDLVADC